MSKLKEINWNAIQKEYNEGLSIAELLLKYEFSYGLLRIAKKKGLFLGSKGRKSSLEVQSILDEVTKTDPQILLSIAE